MKDFTEKETTIEELESRGDSHLIHADGRRFRMFPANNTWELRPYALLGPGRTRVYPDGEGWFKITESGWTHTGGRYPSGTADCTPLRKGDLVRVADFGSPYRFARIIIKRKRV